MKSNWKGGCKLNKPIKTETWNGHEIRFVEKEPGEWWAVLKDVTDALELKTWKMVQRLEKDLLSKYTLPTKGGMQETLTVSPFGIYDVIFSSRKPEAKAFKKWVYDIIEQLRKSSGLEGFQIFRMLDKEHQKEAMTKLKAGLKNPVRVSFIKANTIADKAVSTMFGYPKMVKKGDMTPEMLAHRQPILDDTVELMSANDKFGLRLSVSEKIRERYH
jgi:prophage antirepressor-like protein